MSKESAFQAQLIKDIKAAFPGCIVMKNDPNYIQGIPDLTVLCGGKWAALETKRSENAHVQPNQKYYVDKMNEMSYAAFVCPENRNEVMNELQRTFRPNRTTRISRSE